MLLSVWSITTLLRAIFSVHIITFPLQSRPTIRVTPGKPATYCRTNNSSHKLSSFLPLTNKINASSTSLKLSLPYAHPFGAGYSSSGIASSALWVVSTLHVLELTSDWTIHGAIRSPIWMQWRMKEDLQLGLVEYRQMLTLPRWICLWIYPLAHLWVWIPISACFLQICYQPVHQKKNHQFLCVCITRQHRNPSGSSSKWKWNQCVWCINAKLNFLTTFLDTCNRLTTTLCNFKIMKDCNCHNNKTFALTVTNLYQAGLHISDGPFIRHGADKPLCISLRLGHVEYESARGVS